MGRSSKIQGQVTASSREEFRAFIAEDCLFAKMALQSVLDIRDAASREWHQCLMKRRFWLQNCGIALEIQQSTEDLRFDGQFLLSDKMDETLLLFKDS